ncbi:Mortality factor 4-like protein 1 [Chamberlinius hualienensis]
MPLNSGSEKSASADNKAGSSNVAPKFRFTEGEKVLCFHGPLLYEAKCIKSQVKDKTVKYFIHYSGWNKNWDEWVPESRVLKFNEANLQKQVELEKTHGYALKNKKTAKSTLPNQKVFHRLLFYRLLLNRRVVKEAGRKGLVLIQLLNRMKLL